jgi:hypothetical protein
MSKECLTWDSACCATIAEIRNPDIFRTDEPTGRFPCRTGTIGVFLPAGHGIYFEKLPGAQSARLREAEMSEPLRVKHDCITQSDFEDSNMARSRFENVNLSESRFRGINFSDVLFAAAEIGGTTFRHIGPPPGAEGGEARQRPVLFEEGQLGGSTFRHMDLSGVKIVDCNLEGMTIDGIPVGDLLAEWKKTHS